MNETVVMLSDEPEGPAATRRRIIDAATSLLEAGGRDAVTTRAVAAAAGIQAPTIYRLFGDKRGLLDAVAEQGLAQYIAEKKAHALRPDPIDDLRFGWDLNVSFGLAHPGIFSMINGEPRPAYRLPIVASGLEVLERKITRIAAAGLLRVSEERALNLVRASCVGAVLVLLSQPEDRRDPQLSAAARESTIAAITTSRPALKDSGAVSAAVALQASLGNTPALSPGERLLLSELLAKLAASA